MEGEKQYLNLVAEILDRGDLRKDRTGIGTKCLFGRQLVFNLSEGFPLLTTKKMPWRHIVCELLWIIRGSTNAKPLSEQNIKIWDKNAAQFRKSKEKRGGEEIDEGELEMIYGKQWRNFKGASTNSRNW